MTTTNNGRTNEIEIQIGDAVSILPRYVGTAHGRDLFADDNFTGARGRVTGRDGLRFFDVELEDGTEVNVLRERLEVRTA